MIYHVTDSFVEIEDMSKQMPVLLITHKAESCSQRSAIDEFEKEVVPIVSPLVREIGIRVYWSNIESIFVGNFHRSELRKYLKRNKLAFCGCFLFKNGILVNYKKVGGFAGNPAGYIYAHVCSVKYLWPKKPKEKTYKKYFGHRLTQINADENHKLLIIFGCSALLCDGKT